MIINTLKVVGNGVYINGLLYREVIPRGITPRQWAALENAERILYRRLGSGYNGYTDVMPYESDDEFLGRIWETATYAVEGSYENWDSYSEDVKNSRIAGRVARTLIVLNFGPEALLA